MSSKKCPRKCPRSPRKMSSKCPRRNVSRTFFEDFEDSGNHDANSTYFPRGKAVKIKERVGYNTMTWDNDWDMNAPFGMTRSKVDSQRSLLQVPHYTQVNQTLGYNVDTVKDLSRVIEDDEIRRHISIIKKEFCLWYLENEMIPQQVLH